MSYAASDYDDELSFRGDESVDAGDDERLLTSRGLGDALRGAAVSVAQLTAGLALLLPLLLLAAAGGFALLRWLAAPPSHASAFQPLHFDYTAPAPVATAAFLPQRFLLNGQLAPGTPPNARFLPPGQAFDLTLRLELPESPANQALGVFQVRASLLTARGDVVAVASRPAALRYRSAPARWARAAARAPLLALGSGYEAQTVRVPLFEAFPEQRGAPFAVLKVELLPRGDGGGGGAAPHVAAAAATLTLRLGWLRHALYYWPVTSAVAAVAALFLLLSSAAAAALALRQAGPLLRGEDGAAGAAAARAALSPRPLPPFRGGSEDGTAPPGSEREGPPGSEGATSDGETEEQDGASDGDALSPHGLSDANGLRQRRASAQALHPAGGADA